MPAIWKSIVVSLVIFVAVLTGCFLKMVEYLQYLHFNERGLTHTTPGTEVAACLGGAVIVLVVLNIAVARMFAPKETSKT